MVSNIVMILFLIISLSNIIIDGYSPLARYGHGSIILENKLYFLGGYIKEENGKELNTNDFFYIDLSKPLDKSNPQYTEFTTIAKPPVRISQSSLVPNSQGNGFYVFGGIMNDINDYNDLMILQRSDQHGQNLLMYEEFTKNWSVPITVNSPKFSKLTDFNSVYDHNYEKVYIFGGINDDNQNLVSEMQIFDSESLSWSLASNDVPNLLETLFGYTATLLPNSIIVYIGGDSIKSVNSGRVERNSMSNIYTYDIRNNRWDYIEIDAQGIDPRRGHTAVLASNNRIVVYGGARDDNLNEALPQLIVLDTNDYKWVTPNTKRIEPRTLHTANMFGDYMIISFGKILNPLLHPFNNLSNEIRILDTRTYEWVNSIQNYVKKDEPTDENPKKESSNPFFELPKYIQSIIYCTGGLIIITIIILTYYSIKRKRTVVSDESEYKP